MIALPSPTVALIASVGIIAAYILYRAAFPKPIPGIPYNKEATKRLFGDIPSFTKWQIERPELFSWMAAQCNALNSPVIQLFMRPLGGRPWVILTDFREAQDIMSRRTKEFDRSEFFGDLFTGLLPHHHVHMPTGNEWRKHRRLVADTMSPSFLNDVVAPQIYNTALDMIQLWSEKTRLARGRAFHAMDDVSRGTLDVMWAATFGSQIGTTESQIDSLSKLTNIDLPDSVDSTAVFPTIPTPESLNSIITLTESVEIAMKSPLPRPHHYLALKLYPSLRSARKQKDKLIQGRLDEAWKTFSQGSERDGDIKSALDHVVQREVAAAKKENRPPQYDTSTIKDELFGLLVAGYDTTAITICWGLKFLTSNQHSQSAVRSALRAQFKRAYEAGDNPSVEEVVKADIPILDATIEEINRLSGTSSANMRKALCDTQVLGYHIPKGTNVFMLSQGPGYTTTPIKIDESKRSQGSLDSNDRYGMWEVSDIGTFMPERWLSKNEKGEMEFIPRAGPLHAFGAGPRGCFGKKLAALELKIIFSLVLWNFELQMTPPDLSSFRGRDVMTHVPQQMYLRLAETK